MIIYRYVFLFFYYFFYFFFFNDTATTEIYTRPYTLSLHDALPISPRAGGPGDDARAALHARPAARLQPARERAPRTGPRRGRAAARGAPAQGPPGPRTRRACRAPQGRAEPGGGGAGARPVRPVRSPDARGGGPCRDVAKRSRRARPNRGAPALADPGPGRRAAGGARLEPHQRPDLRVHPLGRPVRLPHDLDVDVRHALERADDPIGVAGDHGAGRAAGRRERHLHPHVTPVDLDVVYQAEVHHVHVELGVLHLSQSIPHRRGVQHGRSPSSQPKLVDRVAPHQTAAPARDPRVQPARHGPHAGEAEAAGEPALPRQEPQDLGSGIGAREHAAVGEHEVHRRRERGERNTERRHPRLVLERDHADPLFPVPPAHPVDPRPAEAALAVVDERRPAGPVTGHRTRGRQRWPRPPAPP